VSARDGRWSEVANGLGNPEGIDVLPDGRIVVAEVGNDRVIVIDPASGEIESAAEGLALGFDDGPGPGLPVGVAAAADGSIYVTSVLENAIYRLRPLIH